MEKQKSTINTERREKKIARSRLNFQKNIKRIKRLDLKIHCLKQEIKKIKLEQFNYYSELLRQGTETRHDGLIWIIKAIWHLGFDISPEYYPGYLDKKGIQYLINIAKISLKHDEILTMFKRLLGLRRKSNIRKLTIKKSEVWTGISVGILNRVLKGRSLSTVNIPNKLKVPRPLLISEIITDKYKQIRSKDNVSSDTSTIYQLESELQKINEQIKCLKKMEATRIGRLLNTNRENIIIRKKIFAGLFGEDGINLERYRSKLSL